MYLRSQQQNCNRHMASKHHWGLQTQRCQKGAPCSSIPRRSPTSAAHPANPIQGPMSIISTQESTRIPTPSSSSDFIPLAALSGPQDYHEEHAEYHREDDGDQFSTLWDAELSQLWNPNLLQSNHGSRYIPKSKQKLSIKCKHVSRKDWQNTFPPELLRAAVGGRN